jgi:hypothetical protein
MKRLSLAILIAALTLAVTERAGAFPGDPAPTDDPPPINLSCAQEGDAPCDLHPAAGLSSMELRAAASGPLSALDALPLRPIELTAADAIGRAYARVVTPDAPVYSTPAGAVIRTVGTGFIFVSTHGSRHVNGEWWTMINAGEWMRQADLQWRDPSEFHGVYIDAWPEREFAWVLQANQPLRTPGSAPNKAVPFLERYQLVTIYATEWAGDWRYYLIAPDQWAKESWLGKVRMNPAPEGVSGPWIDMDLYEQTLVAYVDDQPVYATLVSSGLAQWSTPEGLFQVYDKVLDVPMSGSEGQPDYYYLENVPWNLFFTGDAALHGTYWHDGFGYRHSHGCVNLSPADSLWLYNWAEVGTWVYVHSSDEYQ